MKNDRTHFRKNLSLTAFLLREEGEEQAFTVCNLSLGGIKAHFETPQRLPAEQAVRVRLPELQLEGCMFPVWEQPAAEGGQDVGFEFSSLLGIGDNHYFYRDDHHALEQAFSDSRSG